MGATEIQWADKVWNPIAGCSIHSPGCAGCYAMPMAARLEAMSMAYEAEHGGDPGPLEHYRGLTKSTKAGSVWTGKIAVAPDAIFLAPLKWRKPVRIFVNSMSDLFHDDVPDAVIDRVFAVMALAPQHTFLVLTKRAERMRQYLSDEERLGAALCNAVHRIVGGDPGEAPAWPLSNVWLGVSVEDQCRADERIPHLLNTPAAVRWISVEPMIGPINLRTLCQYNPAGKPWINALTGIVTRGDYLARSPSECSFNTRTRIAPPELPRLNWVVAGGESGRGARPLDLSWIRDLREQCAAAGVPIFIKQLGKTCVMDRTDAATPVALGAGWDALSPGSDLGTVRFRDSHGGDPVEWPKDMRVREFPNMGVR